MATLTASVTVHETGTEPYTLVELAGEADAVGSEELHSVLDAQTRKRPGLLILEMSALRYLDSAALQAIVRANLALRRDGGRLVLVSPRDTVAQVLQMTEVDQMVPVCASVHDALAGTAGGLSYYRPREVPAQAYSPSDRPMISFMISVVPP